MLLQDIGPRQTLEDFQIPVVYENEWVGKQLVQQIEPANILHATDVVHSSLYDSPSFSMIVKTTDEASTNKFQQNMDAIQAAMAEKSGDPTSSTNPLNIIDGNSGPAYSFAQLSASDLEATEASHLIANQSEQAHYEVILWTSLYPLPDTLPTLNNYYDFTNYSMESYVSLASYLLASGTGGNVTIDSTDASASPLINLPMRLHIHSINRFVTLIMNH